MVRSRSFSLFQLIRDSARCSRSPATVSALAVAGLATDTGAAPTEPLAFEFGLAFLPHPEKIAKGGEDAYFYNHSLNAFGIADGVGAWSTMGIDPAKFSRFADFGSLSFYLSKKFNVGFFFLEFCTWFVYFVIFLYVRSRLVLACRAAFVVIKHILRFLSSEYRLIRVLRSLMRLTEYAFMEKDQEGYPS
jgi:hypothetical protein